MANFFMKGKWKKRTLTAMTIALSATLALGFVTACAETTEEEEEESSAASKTDTQLIKNGDFEFYSEMDEDLDDKRALINTPTSWSFTAGSPTSDTSSGIINTDEWSYLTTSGREFTSVEDAVAHWKDDGVTVYDRLKFYEDFEDEIDELSSSSAAAKLFADYNYSIDFGDVEYLSELGDAIELHDEEAQRKNGDTSLLMIHNRRTSDGVRGTGQYYTSGTTITLNAGTSAQVSVWVRTDELYHYYDDNNTAVIDGEGGAYIGVTHTVGGTTLNQMQIKNIRTEGGWKQYTVYLRASTFATTTFKIVLGLGQSSSTDRYYAVDGYAFFDDLECTIMPNQDYEEITAGLGLTETNTDQVCTIDTVNADDKIFDARDGKTNFAIDLYAGFDSLRLDADHSESNNVSVDLTKETSGSKEYTSLIGDNRTDGTAVERQSLAGSYTYGELATAANSNGYFKNIFQNDFLKDGETAFPFLNEAGETNDGAQTILLMSTNGAAYTASVRNSAFTLQPDSRLLVSFFVKTSAIRSGKTGATITLVDGENETEISSFDSTTVSTVDIDNNTESGEAYNQDDIYNGWVQCFFFVSNNTDDALTFYLKLSYGPTSVAGTATGDYSDGYAAFANFEVKENLTKTQLSYASTGNYAKSVSLTGSVSNTSVFDSASATSDIENTLATPANFKGIQAGSINVTEGGFVNPSTEDLAKEEGLYTGLLNAQYASNYMASGEAWATYLNGLSASSDASAWWADIFGDSANSARVANQPLTIINTSNTATKSYGYFSHTATISSATYQKISVRVKLSAGAKAYFYLIDTSDAKQGYNTALTPLFTNVTYWYDDDGNILRKDPDASDFKVKTDTLYYLETNGLYTKAGANNGVYYANFLNYTKDEDGNYVTDDDTIAYYYHDGKYYAYYDKDKNTYSQVVEALPTTDDDGNSILRYDYTAINADKSEYGSVIVVEGTEANAGQWIEVAFYIHTGDEEKSYRLEVWAGARNNDTDGIPAGAYYFFDSYSSASVSSSYESLLAEAVTELKKDTNNLVDPADKSSNLISDYALYYTYTFYDSPSYLRYDVNEDEDGLGNPYGSYAQSAYSEQLVYLRYYDTEGVLTGIPTYSYFLDYSAYDVTVEKDDLSNDDTTTDTDDTKTDSDTNIWMLISSGVLAAALIFAVIAVIVRRSLKKFRKSGDKKKAPKAKRTAPKPIEEKAPKAPAEEPRDEGDPYNE